MNQPCQVELWEKTSARRQSNSTGRLRATVSSQCGQGMRVFRRSAQTGECLIEDLDFRSDQWMPQRGRRPQ
jgi:hypothetical protein